MIINFEIILKPNDKSQNNYIRIMITTIIILVGVEFVFVCEIILKSNNKFWKIWD